tara:strand:+ start:768 stop:926 length:159 start_codon:yes stop_codon:yes gene_type:complete
MGPFQNKGDFRKSKDAPSLEISVQNWITFGHMAQAACEKCIFLNIILTEEKL